jgi:hypothetical protein
VSLLTLLLVLIVLSVVFGGWGWGTRRTEFGYYSWGPAGLLVVILLVLLVTGYLH